MIKSSILCLSISKIKSFIFSGKIGSFFIILKFAGSRFFEENFNSFTVLVL